MQQHYLPIPKLQRMHVFSSITSYTGKYQIKTCQSNNNVSQRCTGVIRTTALSWERMPSEKAKRKLTTLFLACCRANVSPREHIRILGPPRASNEYVVQQWLAKMLLRLLQLASIGPGFHMSDRGGGKRVQTDILTLSTVSGGIRTGGHTKYI